VRFGHTQREPIPECGCDACDEAVDDCAQLLREIVNAVTSGEFGERIVHAADGSWHETWRATELGSRSGRTLVTAVEALALRQKLGSDDARWAPWPLRPV
jgi:hypothetical protein